MRSNIASARSPPGPGPGPPSTFERGEGRTDGNEKWRLKLSSNFTTFPLLLSSSNLITKSLSSNKRRSYIRSMNMSENARSHNFLQRN
jgi:hypothetical protein